jgi:AcrR family transcriptional regulator
LVLRESGLSARTFYRHFPDKDSLLVAVIRDEYAATARLLADATAHAGSDPRAAIAIWIREFLSSATDPARERRARLFSAHHAVMSKHPEATAEAYGLVIHPLHRAIEAGTAEGLFRSVDPASDARQVARLAGGALTEILSQRPSDTEIGDVIASIIEFVMRALSTPFSRSNPDPAPPGADSAS